MNIRVIFFDPVSSGKVKSVTNLGSHLFETSAEF